MFNIYDFSEIIFNMNWKLKIAVYMSRLSRTEILSTDQCSKFRGAPFSFVAVHELKNM